MSCMNREPISKACKIKKNAPETQCVTCNTWKCHCVESLLLLVGHRAHGCSTLWPPPRPHLLNEKRAQSVCPLWMTHAAGGKTPNVLRSFRFQKACAFSILPLRVSCALLVRGDWEKECGLQSTQPGVQPQPGHLLCRDLGRDPKPGTKSSPFRAGEEDTHESSCDNTWHTLGVQMSVRQQWEFAPGSLC